MESTSKFTRTSFVSSLLVGAGLALGGPAFAADDYKAPMGTSPTSPSTSPLPSSPSTPPEVPAAKDSASSSPSMDLGKAVAPSKSETPDAAFKKLDVGNKGYVTAEDTKVLENFDAAFNTADTKHTGKLNLAQFKKAWSSYTGQAGPSGPKGSAGEKGQSDQSTGKSKKAY